MATNNGAYMALAATLLGALSVPAFAQNAGGYSYSLQNPGQVLQPATNPDLHPVSPLLGRRFQNGGGQQSLSYGNNNSGYYGYNPNTLIVPTDNGGAYIFGGAGGWPGGGVTSGANGYGDNYGYPTYSVPQSAPNQPTYDNSGAYAQAPQPSVNNIYNTYNYYSAPPAAGVSQNANAVQPSTQSSPPIATANPSALPAWPTTPPTIAGTAGFPGSMKPDDADLLATAYSDIQHAWLRGDVSLLKKHVDILGNIAVLSKTKYQYSLAADKFITQTDSMFDQIQTKSFTFTAVQKQANGDITAFATHIYNLRSGDDSDAMKSLYVSYAMSKNANGWMIVAVDSSQTPLLTDTSGGSNKTINYSNSN